MTEQTFKQTINLSFLEMSPLFGESGVWRPVFVWLYELFTEDCVPHSAGIPPPVYVHSARTEAAGRAARRQSGARRETSTSPRPWSTSLSWRGGALLPPPFIRYANQPVGFSREQTNFPGRYKALGRIQRGLPGRIHDNLLISDHLLIQWRCCPTVDPVFALNRPDFLTHLCLLFTRQLTLH